MPVDEKTLQAIPEGKGSGIISYPCTQLEKIFILYPHEPMNRNWKLYFLIKLLRPDGLSSVLFLLAMMVLTAGIAFALLASADPYGGMQAGLGITALCILPLTTLLMEIASWASRRAGPRLALGALALFSMLINIGLFCGSSSDSSQTTSLTPLSTFATGYVALLLLGSPFLLLASIPIGLALVQLPKEINTMRIEESERLADVIRQEGGFVTDEELSRRLGIPEKAIDRLLAIARESGQIQGIRDRKHKLFLTDTALAKKQNELLALVEAHAQISIADLASALRVPQEMVKEWIYHLVGQGKYTGYIHWEEGTLFSKEAEALRQLDNCPRCGGALSMAGKGIVHCQHCGSDIFLGVAPPNGAWGTAPARKQGRKQAGAIDRVKKTSETA